MVTNQLCYSEYVYNSLKGQNHRRRYHDCLDVGGSH